MKKITLATAPAVLAATAANAGSLVDPIVEPEIVVETATSSSAPGIIVPLIFLAAVGGAIWLGV